jgi:hypothetical protein
MMKYLLTFLLLALVAPFATAQYGNVVGKPVVVHAPVVVRGTWNDYVVNNRVALVGYAPGHAVAVRQQLHQVGVVVQSHHRQGNFFVVRFPRNFAWNNVVALNSPQVVFVEPNYAVQVGAAPVVLQGHWNQYVAANRFAVVNFAPGQGVVVARQVSKLGFTVLQAHNGHLVVQAPGHFGWNNFVQLSQVQHVHGVHPHVHAARPR